MLIAGIATIVMLMCIIYRILLSRQQQKQKIVDGINVTIQLRQIIDCCQKHRGTSNALLQGNEQLRSTLNKLQDEIDLQISDHSSHLLSTFPQWESFTEHWPRLKSHAIKSDLMPYDLVRQHSLMIDSQLMLLDDVMRRYDLHHLMLDSYTRVSEVCLDTLRVAEMIGQARAIGSGICARGECKGADRIRLNFLSISMKSTTNQLLHEVNSIKNTELTASLHTTSIAIREKIDALLNMVEKRVLQPGELQVKTQDYFLLSTNAIDEVMNIFSTVIKYASKQHTRLI